MAVNSNLKKGGKPVEELANRNPTVSESEMAADALDSLELSINSEDIVPKTQIQFSDSENDGIDLLLEMENAEQTFSAEDKVAPKPEEDILGSSQFDDVGENTLATIVGALDDKNFLKQAANPEPTSPEPLIVEASATEDDIIKPEFSEQESPEEATRFSEIPEIISEETKLAGPDGDAEILKRYATIKEREVRERDVNVQVVKKQLEKISKEHEISEKERRNLQIRYDEMYATLKSLEDLRDKQQHLMRKLEMQHAEDLKALQARLESAQYQSQKAERKFEEFRDRVKSDLLKIRSRERELASKLELQKRDAEALLLGKDERLLAQKRDIDRLEFEIQNLKERMIEETEKAEERAGKLTRALQSLRMAQGMLSGIDEEVLPGAKPGGSSGGQAA
jgi:hypothetical protein